MFSDSHHRCPHVTEQVSQLTEKVLPVTPIRSHVCSCDMGHCTCDNFTCDILEGLFYRRHLLFNRTAFIEETLENILNRFCYGLIIKYCREGIHLWSVLNGELAKLDSRATFVYSGSLLQAPFLEASD